MIIGVLQLHKTIFSAGRIARLQDGSAFQHVINRRSLAVVERDPLSPQLQRRRRPKYQCAREDEYSKEITQRHAPPPKHQKNGQHGHEAKQHEDDDRHDPAGPRLGEFE